MSRIPREDVWNFWLGNLNLASCFCCQGNMMDREDSKTWVRGHLIHHKDHGLDIYENICPICIDCNTEDKSFPSNFHYRVYLGLMTKKEADAKVAEMEEHFNRSRNNPETNLCVAQGCQYRRKGRSLTCGVHASNKSHTRYFLRDKVLEYRRSALERLKQILANKDAYDPDEFSQIVRDLKVQVEFGSTRTVAI